MTDPSAEERKQWRSEHSYPEWQENRLNKTCQARGHPEWTYWPCLKIRWLDALDERDEARAYVERAREATLANASACPHICNQCMNAELGTPRG